MLNFLWLFWQTANLVEIFYSTNPPTIEQLNKTKLYWSFYAKYSSPNFCISSNCHIILCYWAPFGRWYICPKVLQVWDTFHQVNFNFPSFCLIYPRIQTDISEAMLVWIYQALCRVFWLLSLRAWPLNRTSQGH